MILRTIPFHQTFPLYKHAPPFLYSTSGESRLFDRFSASSFTKAFFSGRTDFFPLIFPKLLPPRKRIPPPSDRRSGLSFVLLLGGQPFSYPKVIPLRDSPPFSRRVTLLRAVGNKTPSRPVLPPPPPRFDSPPSCQMNGVPTSLFPSEKGFPHRGTAFPISPVPLGSTSFFSAPTF